LHDQTIRAAKRQQAWQKQLAITRLEVEELMRLRYDPEADVLLFILRDEPPVDAVQERGGVIIS
jgi:hypothetical protein